jgi:hypothetical protein
MSAGSTREFDLPQSSCSIPSTAVAYSLNATVVPNAALGYLTLWPAGESQPTVSTLNSDGRIKANAAIVPAGTNGGVDVYVTDATQVILDIDGYFVPAGTSSALAFYPVTPCRVADTRTATGSLGGPIISSGTSRAFPVQSSSCGIPSTAQAYSMNVTAVPHGTLGYLTTWPTGASQPVVSTLNSNNGEVVANATIVPAGTSGDISVYVSNTSDVALDINGYFAPPGTGGLSLYTLAPCRALDTRTGAGPFTATQVANVEGGTCAPPSTAQAYVLNATVVPNGGLSYLTLWPDGQTQPLVSTLNAPGGATTSNMAIVPTTDGSIDAFAATSTNLVLDLSGYFAPATSQLTASTTSLAFGNVVAGSSATLPVTLTSSGTAAATVNSGTISGAGFTVSGTTFPVTLNPNQSVTLNVQFAPMAGGAATGMLTINSASSITPTSTVSLSGMGATSQLSLSTPSLAFGDVVDGTSATLPVTLTSSGTAAVTVNSGKVSGAGFTVSGATFPVTLSPNQAVTLNVQFAPTAGGAATGALSINSNSSSTPNSTVTLSGTGSHTVNLAWQPPTTSSFPVTGYDVYRATGSSSSYQLLSSTAQASYGDSTIQSGTAYSYYVVSVDSSGVQSSPSNSVTVTVPTP